MAVYVTPTGIRVQMRPEAASALGYREAEVEKPRKKAEKASGQPDVPPPDADSDK